MKSKLLFSTAIAFSLLCAACSDSTTSANVDDIADMNDDGTPEDSTTHKKQSVETENGSTFEIKGTGSDNEYGFLVDEAAVPSSYKGDVKETAFYDAVYDESVPSVMVPGDAGDYAPGDYDFEPGGDFDEDYNGRTYGLLTASEWNDLDNWSSWEDILTGEFSDKTSYWKFYPTTLAVVKVVDKDGEGLANVSVELLKGDDVEFATKTDNNGFAYCWVNLFDGNTKDAVKEKDFSLKVNGKVSEDPVKFTTKNDDSVKENVITSDAKQADAKADVAFIVDATGSMGDEIRFLQSDLSYIIDHAHSDTKVDLRTAVLFYRDEDDKYLVQGKDFSTDVANTQAFIEEQFARSKQPCRISPGTNLHVHASPS